MGAVRSVDWIFITWAPAGRWLGEYVTLDKRFYKLFSKLGAAASPMKPTSTFSPLSHSSEAFIRNVISILCCEYLYDIIIICINNDNAIIHNNYGRLQDLILLFKIPMGTRKDFIELYGQSGHAPSKRLASPWLGVWVENRAGLDVLKSTEVSRFWRGFLHESSDVQFSA